MLSGIKNVIAFVGAFLVLVQAVAGAAVPQFPPGFNPTCTPKYPAAKRPLAADCKKALEKVTPGEPEFCTLQFQTEYDYVTVGTCTIHTSSKSGKAHCLDGDRIIAGVKAILKLCSSEASTGGSYEWAAGEGVSLV